MPVLERLFFAVAGIAILAGLIASYGIADRRQMSTAVAVLVASSPRSGTAEPYPCRLVISVQHLLSPLPATSWFGRDYTWGCGAGETSGGNRMIVQDVSLSGMPESRP